MPQRRKPEQIKIRVSLPQQLVNKLDALVSRPGQRSLVIEQIVSQYIRDYELAIGRKLDKDIAT